MEEKIKELINRYEKEWDSMGKATSYSSVIYDLRQILNTQG